MITVAPGRTPGISDATEIQRRAIPRQRFSTLEIAAGLPLGLFPVPPTAAPTSPRPALEAILTEALTRPPCVIAFSGGRDSSSLLAAAVAVARHKGLELPIAATLEFDATSTHEREWQEMVLAHLDLCEWVRLRPGEELDLVGPIATAGLRRWGLLYPANAHVIVPLARAAAGGTLLTGVGGDDVFGRWPWHDLGSVAAGRRPARRSDVKRLAHLVAPEALRAAIIRRRQPLLLPWIVASHRERVARAVAAEYAAMPRTWSARMRWSARWRAWRLTTESMALLAADHEARLYSPFLDPGFLASLAAAGGRVGWGGRGETMRALFADLLPDPVLRRTTKAEFSAPLFGSATREFAARWDGRAGPVTELLDVDALRRMWGTFQPHFGSSLVLHAAWLATHGA